MLFVCDRICKTKYILPPGEQQNKNETTHVHVVSISVLLLFGFHYITSVYCALGFFAPGGGFVFLFVFWVGNNIDNTTEKKRTHIIIFIRSR